MRMTAEKLDGDTEKYEYDYCLCGAVKRQRYIYADSLANSQTMDWTWTTDKLGRAKKLYHPYEIAKDGDDKYYSLLWEYDKAGRRTVYSDPTYGHTAADTSGWTNHTEPSDETDWVFGEPERYLYGETGGLSAMGRVAGAEVRAGDGEPYFVKRDAAGRIASVIYPNKADTEKPEYELKYTYTNDGQLSQVATVYMGSASSGTYGPQTFVVQYFYDDAGRLVKKVVRNNEFSEATQYETSYEFDGMGRMVREKIAVYDTTSKMMQVLQDKRTTYDLGGNATEVKFYDNSGWAFTETRSYARGYQLTGFSTTNAAGVIVISGGSYTYDTNNNLTGTKSLNVRRGVTQLEFRAQWTFTYDRKNRLKSFTNTNASYVRGNLWYDGQGRVWQRWSDNSSTEDWDATLTRYVYNGALAQEHEFAVGALMGSWVYTYDELTRDYLRQPAGLRQRERSGGNDTDYYMLLDGARLEGKAEREATSSALAGREERSASLNQISGRTFENISNLATDGTYIEGYGDSTTGYDALINIESTHYISGIGMFLNISATGISTMPALSLASAGKAEPGTPNKGCYYCYCPRTHGDIFYSGDGMGCFTPEEYANTPNRMPCMAQMMYDCSSCPKCTVHKQSGTSTLPTARSLSDPGLCTSPSGCCMQLFYPLYHTSCPAASGSLYYDCYYQINDGQVNAAFDCVRDCLPDYLTGGPSDNNQMTYPVDKKLLKCLIMAESWGNSSARGIHESKPRGCFQINEITAEDCLQNRGIFSYFSDDCLRNILGSLIYNRLIECKDQVTTDCLLFLQFTPIVSLLCALTLMCRYPDDNFYFRFQVWSPCGHYHMQTRGSNIFHCCMECCQYDELPNFNYEYYTLPPTGYGY